MKIFNTKTELLLLIGIAILIFTLGLGSYALFDLDEPRYAEAAREMINTKEYYVPLFNFEPRYDKPILFYWAEIFSFKVLGVNELAARLPSALAGIALAVIIYAFANFYQIALLTSLIFISSLEIFVMSRLSVTDTLLNLFVSTTLLISFLVIDKKIPGKYLILAGLSLGFALLTKGPVAIILPGLILLIYLFCTKSLEFIKINYQELLQATLICILTALPWYLVVHHKTHGEFTKIFFFEHNFNRYSSTLTGHDAAWWYYLAVMAIGFMPWTIYAFSILLQKITKPKALFFQLRNLSKLSLFSIIWILVILVFFSMAQTKLPNYVLPLYLPLAILLAEHLDKVLLSQTRKKIFFGFFLLITIVYCFATELVFKPMAQAKQAGIIKFSSMIDKDSDLYLIKLIRPSVVFYSQKTVPTIRFKEFVLKASSKPKQCFIAKKHWRKKISEQNQLYIWFEDKQYLFGCNYGLL